MILLSILNIYYTILSFCDLWSRNIWYFIYSYKIIGIIVENYFETILLWKLLLQSVDRRHRRDRRGLLINLQASQTFTLHLLKKEAAR